MKELLAVVGIALILGGAISIFIAAFFLVRMIMGVRQEYRYATWLLGPFSLLFSWPWTEDGNAARKKMILSLLFFIVLGSSAVGVMKVIELE